MTPRPLLSWPMLLADLCIILFMITAAALSQAGDGRKRPYQSPQAEPLAVYRSGRDAPQLGQWLASQPRDPRQMLTIVAPYRAGRQVEALANAEALAREAGEIGLTARIVVEPGDGESMVTLAFDRAPAALAQSLQGSGQTLSPDSKGP